MTTTATSPTPTHPTPGSPTAVRARGLTKTYGRGDTAVVALDSVDVDLLAGEFTAVMGPSGSGKSTLMHCLAGLDSPTSGTITLGDNEISGMSDARLTRLRRDHVGFVFQSFNLLPMLTAEQNVTLPLRLGRRRPDREWFDTIVDTLGIRSRLRHLPSELSGGQQQRVAVARALVTRPDVLFADEPTGALDSTTSAEMLAFLRRSVRELDQTVVMVTHDPGAAAYADRVVLLADGHIAGDLREPTADRVLDALRSLGG